MLESYVDLTCPEYTSTFIILTSDDDNNWSKGIVIGQRSVRWADWLVLGSLSDVLNKEREAARQAALDDDPGEICFRVFRGASIIDGNYLIQSEPIVNLWSMQQVATRYYVIDTRRLERQISRNSVGEAAGLNGLQWSGTVLLLPQLWQMNEGDGWSWQDQTSRLAIFGLNCELEKFKGIWRFKSPPNYTSVIGRGAGLTRPNSSAPPGWIRQ